VSGDTEELGALVTLTAKTSKPASSSSADSRGNGHSLDVGDSRRASEKTNSGRERRLKTRLSGLSLERLDKRSLLTTDVGTGTSVQVNIEIVTGFTGVLSDQAGGVSLVDGSLKNSSLLDEFTTDVDVGSGRVHGSARDEASLDELVWVLSHNLTVLAGSGLTLIGVDDEVTGLVVLVPVLEVHERPFETRGETSTTSSSETRGLDLADDPIVTLEDNLLGLVPVTHLPGALEVDGISVVKVLENAILVSQTSVCSLRGAVLDSSQAPHGGP